MPFLLSYQNCAVLLGKASQIWLSIRYVVLISFITNKGDLSGLSVGLLLRFCPFLSCIVDHFRDFKSCFNIEYIFCHMADLSQLVEAFQISFIVCFDMN